MRGTAPSGGDPTDPHQRPAVWGDGVRPLGRGGLTVGRLGFGAAPIGNLGRVVSDADAEAAAQAAWMAGIRYYDTAPHYGLGLSERRLGRALAHHPRAEMVISTKVGRVLVPVDDDPGARDDEGFDVPRTFRRILDYSRDGVMRSLEASMRRLGTDRIDIVFVHDPDDHEREALDGAFPALEELRSQRVIRSYGAGMNQSAMLTRFVRATDLDVVMLAGRYSLIDQSGLDDLLPAALESGVSVAAAGVFNSGLLSRDQPTAGLTYDYAPAGDELLARARRIADVCRSHGVTLPQAAVQFGLRHPAVATVVLGARTAEHVERNTALLHQPVPESLWEELGSLGLVRTSTTGREE